MYNNRLVFWAACAGMFLFGICLITLGTIAADLREKLMLGDLSAGALFAILPIGVLAGSLVFGPLADKYGYRALLPASCFLMSIGFEGVAISSSPGLLKIFILLFGIGGGAVNGATNAVVADISEKAKGASLSLLGVAYGIGAIGMPLISGILKNILSFETIVISIGIITLAIGIWIMFIKFPPPKQSAGFLLSGLVRLIKDGVLIAIAFYLFFQSGFESIINNWTTTFLVKEHSLQTANALFALSLFVAGMTIMRLLSGSIFRNVTEKKLLIISFAMIVTGLILLKAGNSFSISVTGLALLGAGLAGGFPIMLGFVGHRYAEISGTAFSFVLVIALLGNTLINYTMGAIAQRFGVVHLVTLAFAVTIAMMILGTFIVSRLNKHI